MDLIVTILPVVTKDIPISPRFTHYNFFIAMEVQHSYNLYLIVAITVHRYRLYTLLLVSEFYNDLPTRTREAHCTRLSRGSHGQIYTQFMFYEARTLFASTNNRSLRPLFAVVGCGKHQAGTTAVEPRIIDHQGPRRSYNNLQYAWVGVRVGIGSGPWSRK